MGMTLEAIFIALKLSYTNNCNLLSHRLIFLSSNNSQYDLLKEVTW